ncbi:MAG: oxygenase MpaB family protein [Aquiluna sp.]
MANNALQENLSRRFRRLLSGAQDGIPPWLEAVAEGDDPGLFLPTDAPWIVHRDFATLVGGIRALLLQALHPGALGGVAQHSRYEEDPLGRLSGTIRWLTVTTFGSMVAVQNEASRVNRMHERVKGKYETNDGQHINYRAADPDLLLWVHIAFMDSFLRAHQNYSRAKIPGGADSYVALWSRSVEPLGLSEVPMTEVELAQTLEKFEPRLRVDAKAKSVIRWIRNAPLPRAAKPVYSLLFQAALASLPRDLRKMIGMRSLPLWLLKPLVTNLLAFGRFAIGPDSPIEDAALARLSRLGIL